MGSVLKRYAVPLGILGTGVASVGYASLIERNWFHLRRYDVPVLAPGQRPIKILHISDTHLTPGRRRLITWVSALD
ncbi:MAG: metallophosphoesterase, partial [Actinoallomurus sp.]